MRIDSELAALLSEFSARLNRLLGTPQREPEPAPPAPPQEGTRRDIAAYVAGEVKAGRVAPEHAERLKQILRDEAAGKLIVMRPCPKPKLPRKSSWTTD
jgi:hypothetical protein